MEKNNSKFRNNLVSKVFLIILFLLGINVQAQFSANWPFTSGLGATVSGASSGTVTASAATYTAGTGNLFTGTVTSNTGSLVGIGITGKGTGSCTTLYNAVGSSTPITPYMEYKITPNAGNSMTTNSFMFTVTSANAASGSSIAAGFSSDGGASFTGLAGPSGGGAGAVSNSSPTGSTWSNVGLTSSTTLTFTVPPATIAATKSFILRIVIWRNSGSNHSTANISISSPTITGTTAVSLSPVIATPSPPSLTNFNYNVGSGPSASQPFIVSGANLTADITATASTNYEVSSDNISFSGSAAVASGTLYARLKSGLATGTYNSENIVLSSPGAASQNVTCSGGVSSVYYYMGTGALENVSSWGLNTDGTGANPANFTTTYQTFIINNTTTVTTTAPWTVSGVASKIILGNASSPAITLTIASGNGITGTVDIAAATSGSNDLVVQDTTLPTFGILDPTSMIDIQGGVSFTGSQTFPNNITVSNAGVLTLNNSSGYVYTIGGNLTVTGSGGIVCSNTVSTATANTLVLSGTGKTYKNTASANNFVKTSIIIDGTYALAGDFTFVGTSASRSITINSGKSLDLAGYTLDLSLGSLGGTGAVTTSNSNSKVVTSNVSPTPLPSARTWGGTVEYASLTGGQRIVSAASYTNLKLDNTSGTNTVASGDLTISAMGSLTVNSGTNLSIPGALVNNAAASAVVIENNANLIQATGFTNTGAITVKRNSNPLKRLDYTMWSSPTGVSQKLNEFSPLTSTGRFYDYNPSSNLYNVVADATPFSQGKGFLIRMPNTDPTVGYDAGSATLVYPGVFTGIPNNGNVNITGTAGQYVAVGNPYPSTISANAFIAANLSPTDPTPLTTLYFWRKNNNLGQGSTPTTSYATYTTAGGVANGGFTPSSDIAVGQGFITTVPTGGTIAFTNAMRTSSNSAQFLRTKAPDQKNRVWLNLSQDSNPVNQILVAYMDGATTGVDAGIDGKYINDAATALTSNINGDEYVIQGRPAFDVSDVVALNFKTAAAGNFTIAKDQADGLFANGQAVYLVDATTGTETNLQTDAYTFSAAVGSNNGRFSLKYQKTLGVNTVAFDENSISVYKQNGVFNINAGNTTMKNIKVFDIQGRLILEQKEVNATTTSLKNLVAGKQAVLIQITSEDNRIVTKKAIN